jgi:hypothetical protein
MSRRRVRAERGAVQELEHRVGEGRRRINDGERPVYHVISTFAGAAVDVRIRELPIIHVFVPDASGVVTGARGLIAKTLGVAPSAFEVRADSHDIPAR